MRSPENVIKRPLLTEKGNRLKDGGVAAGEGEPVRSQVVFEVAKEANKIEIRHAVEKLWNVDVINVRTLRMPGKVKRLGRFQGRSTGIKKAIVTLAAGQNIEFFEGV